MGKARDGSRMPDHDAFDTIRWDVGVMGVQALLAMLVRGIVYAPRCCRLVKTVRRRPLVSKLFSFRQEEHMRKSRDT